MFCNVLKSPTDSNTNVYFWQYYIIIVVLTVHFNTLKYKWNWKWNYKSICSRCEVNAVNGHAERTSENI